LLVAPCKASSKIQSRNFDQAAFKTDNVCMDATLINAKASIAKLCVNYGVRSLDAFGSATQSAMPNDYDFIVELDTQADRSMARRWIDLAESLEKLLGKPVDLVSTKSISNPYFAQTVAATRTPIYARASA
jgi:uncharacterized protein